MDHNPNSQVIDRFVTRGALEPVSRRRALVRGGLLAATAAIGATPGGSSAKKKRRKKNRGQSLKLSDWLGTWFTRLSNGVQGTATFRMEFGQIVGNYSNSVGSGVFRCYEDPGGKSTDLGCRYDQTEGELGAGGFQIDLTDKNHWEGSYQIDGGESGTWSGDRR